MHELKEGDVIGLRGPYGRPFAMEEFKSAHLLFVAGGIGLAPLRGVINYCLDNRQDYGRITILAGSRCPDDVSFAEDLHAWKEQPDVTCAVTVDVGDDKWPHHVGLVTTLLDRFTEDPAASKALVCGPPLMIRFVMADLAKRGFADADIITTMERHMKCGVGICGHCHMDNKLVCIDGPVFSRAELKDLDIEELRA
jgi:NAD(P)H-flavin reductase